MDYCGGQILPAALSLKYDMALIKNATNLMRIAATMIDVRAEVDLTNTDVYDASFYVAEIVGGMLEVQ